MSVVPALTNMIAPSEADTPPPPGGDDDQNRLVRQAHVLKLFLELNVLLRNEPECDYLLPLRNARNAVRESLLVEAQLLADMTKEVNGEQDA